MIWLKINLLNTNQPEINGLKVICFFIMFIILRMIPLFDDLYYFYG